MLAQKMFVVQFARQRPGVRVNRERVECHARHVFQNDGIVGCVGRTLAPAEWGMPATSTAGIASGSSCVNVRQMASPVSNSYSPAISSGLSRSVAGTGP